MESLRFIHCADLHLDRPFQGLADAPAQVGARVRESTFRSFCRIVDAAIEHDVDLVIIAGDLFDSEHSSLRAQARFRDEMERLEGHGIEVYVVHGNHDHLSGEGVPLNWPENVHVFRGGEVEVIPFFKNNEALAHLYGFSYQQRAVTKRMSRFYEKKDNARYHIGILHGNIEGGGDHDSYAPFTVRELLEREFDYWALGHIHIRQLLHEQPTMLYPGNIQGLNRKETGEKGCTLVEIDGTTTNLSFIPTADVEWHTCEISISGKDSVEGILKACEYELKGMRREKTGVLVTFVFTGVGSLHHYFQEEDNVDDLLLTLREGEEVKENFVWPVSCQIRTTLNWNRNELKEEGHFIGDLLQMIDRDGVADDALSSLFENRRARRFLDGMDEQGQAEVLREAENLLLTDLLGKER